MQVQPCAEMRTHAAKWAQLCRRARYPGHGLAVVPEVAFLHDKPVGPETEQRHPGQILAAVGGDPMGELARVMAAVRRFAVWLMPAGRRDWARRSGPGRTRCRRLHPVRVNAVNMRG